jgi:3-dehydroquinate dehydratase type I
MAKTNQEALRKMAEVLDPQVMLELRIDGLRKANLKKLMAASKGPILVTNRSPNEGGFFRGGEEERVALLEEAVELGADYVDLELRTEPSLIQRLKEKINRTQRGTQLILSYHNPEQTPRVHELKGILEEGRKIGAPIVKIVPLAKEVDDNLEVLRLIPYARQKGVKVIAFCMGEKGKISRIVAPLLGSYLTYAAWSKGKEAAPGQMTIKEMMEIFRIVKG